MMKNWANNIKNAHKVISIIYFRELKSIVGDTEVKVYVYGKGLRDRKDEKTENGKIRGIKYLWIQNQ